MTGDRAAGWSSVSPDAVFCGSRPDAGACCVILDSIHDGVFAIDPKRRVISFFNRAAENITGFTRREAVGRCCFDVFRSNVCQTDCPLERTLATRKPVYDFPCTIINKKGEEVAISVTTAVILDEKGGVLGGVEIFRDLSALETLRKALYGKYRLGDIISKNPRMQEIFQILPDIAESDSTVLIQGPSGSGKEVVASAIHELSTRKEKPFVRVNCGAIPDTLLESELFGYVRGAFTDARKDKPGRFTMAHKGTLFLDEICNTSPALQVKLLRVLEERQFVPLGGTAPVKADVRIVAASNQCIESLVQRGTFREDLFYRLNIIRIQLPPLRDRKEDIPLLTDFLLSKLSSIRRRKISGVSEEVMALFLNYDFPGNVRELENILEHAYVLCKAPLIEKRHLPVEFLAKVQGVPPVTPTKTLLECSEEKTILDVLTKHEGCRISAARELGMSRSTLWRKIRKYRLKTP